MVARRLNMVGKTLVCSPWKINFFGRLRSFRYPHPSSSRNTNPLASNAPPRPKLFDSCIINDVYCPVDEVVVEDQTGKAVGRESKRWRRCGASDGDGLLRCHSQVRVARRRCRAAYLEYAKEKLQSGEGRRRSAPTISGLPATACAAEAWTQRPLA